MTFQNLKGILSDPFHRLYSFHLLLKFFLVKNKVVPMLNKLSTMP
jgi:hypothetical protein